MSTKKKNSSKNAKAALARNLIAGTKKAYPNGSTVLHFGGADHTVDEVTTKLQSIVDHRDAVVAAQTVATAKVEAETAQEPTLNAFMSDYVKFLRGVNGNGTEQLSGFGIAPTKARTPLTGEQLAAAKAKRDATLEARGITSKKVRNAIKGAVTGVTITPVTVVPAPSAGGAPAAAVAAPTPGASGPAPAATPPATTPRS
jgi:hypothetical protein